MFKEMDFYHLRENKKQLLDIGLDAGKTVSQKSSS